MSLARTLLVTLIALGACGAGRGAADELRSVSASENDLKAAFVFNFAKFVEWPPTPPAAAITIDVIDDEPLAAALKRTVEGKRAQSRVIVVHAESHGREAWDGDIAVIGSDADGTVAWQLDRLKGRPVLTVGDSPRFLQLGGMIQLRLVDSRLQFDINPDAAVRNGLRISAKLIVLARDKGHAQ